MAIPDRLGAPIAALTNQPVDLETHTDSRLLDADLDDHAYEVLERRIEDGSVGEERSRPQDRRQRCDVAGGPLGARPDPRQLGARLQTQEQRALPRTRQQLT